MTFCSFQCPHSDSRRAQHAACQAVNGVYCTILKRIMEKGMPCPVPDEERHHPPAKADD